MIDWQNLYTPEERVVLRDGLPALEAHIREETLKFYDCVYRYGFPEIEEACMKVTYSSPNGRIRFEQDGLDRKKAFEFVACVQELFEEPCCGLCLLANIQCRVREYEGNKYYNLVCVDCGAQADFGQRK